MTEQTTVKIPCEKCGHLILPSTSKRTGGVCMPCYSHSDFPEVVEEDSTKSQHIALEDQLSVHPSTIKRSIAKDTIAWSIIYGGTALAQTGFFIAAVSAGLLSPSVAKNLASNPSIRRVSSEARKKAWDKYKETGNLFRAIQGFFS